MINNIRLNLKHYRELKKISQIELAKKMKITQGYISKVEKGIESPTVRMVYRFAYALEICPRLLLPCIIECKEHNNCNYGGNINESRNI